MTTHRRPILGFATVPDGSGNVWLEPLTVLATNDAWGHLIARFKDTATRIGLNGSFKVPKNFVSAPKIIITWSAAAITGNVQWSTDYRTVAVGQSLDQVGTEESVNSGAVAAPGTAHFAKETALALTAANLSVDETVQFAVFRDGTSGNDTMAADAYVVAIEFEYADV